MFKTVDQLKEFILWAKSEKIQRIRIDKIEVEIHQVALLDDLINLKSQSAPVDSKTVSVDVANEAARQTKEEEELLYHSTTL